MKVFKLISTPDGSSAFQEGTLPEMTHIAADHFFVQTYIENIELSVHTAPRYQFVVTLKGKLKFTVSNGTSFIIEPGIILIATDIAGKGHSWELLEEDEWQRIYIVPPHNATDHFRISTEGSLE